MIIKEKMSNRRTDLLQLLLLTLLVVAFYPRATNALIGNPFGGKNNKSKNTKQDNAIRDVAGTSSSKGGMNTVPSTASAASSSPFKTRFSGSPRLETASRVGTSSEFDDFDIVLAEVQAALQMAKNSIPNVDIDIDTTVFQPSSPSSGTGMSNGNGAAISRHTVTNTFASAAAAAGAKIKDKSKNNNNKKKNNRKNKNNDKLSTGNKREDEVAASAVSGVCLGLATAPFISSFIIDPATDFYYFNNINDPNIVVCPTLALACGAIAAYTSSLDSTPGQISRAVFGTPVVNFIKNWKVGFDSKVDKIVTKVKTYPSRVVKKSVLKVETAVEDAVNLPGRIAKDAKQLPKKIAENAKHEIQQVTRKASDTISAAPKQFETAVLDAKRIPIRLAEDAKLEIREVTRLATETIASAPQHLSLFKDGENGDDHNDSSASVSSISSTLIENKPKPIIVNEEDDGSTTATVSATTEQKLDEDDEGEENEDELFFFQGEQHDSSRTSIDTPSPLKLVFSFNPLLGKKQYREMKDDRIVDLYPVPPKTPPPKNLINERK